jgi:hypothetical protein
MSATIPWSPVQLWKRHRGATIAGFLPALLLLILLTTQASNSVIVRSRGVTMKWIFTS